jgi:hypothetical protein
LWIGHRSIEKNIGSGVLHRKEVCSAYERSVIFDYSR